MDKVRVAIGYNLPTVSLAAITHFDIARCRDVALVVARGWEPVTPPDFSDIKIRYGNTIPTSDDEIKSQCGHVRRRFIAPESMMSMWHFWRQGWCEGMMCRPESDFVQKPRIGFSRSFFFVGRRPNYA